MQQKQPATDTRCDRRVLTYELVVKGKARVGSPEALLLCDSWQVSQSLIPPVVQLGQTGPRSPLHNTETSHGLLSADIGCMRGLRFIAEQHRSLQCKAKIQKV